MLAFLQLRVLAWLQELGVGIEPVQHLANRRRDQTLGLGLGGVLVLNRLQQLGVSPKSIGDLAVAGDDRAAYEPAYERRGCYETDAD